MLNSIMYHDTAKKQKKKIFFYSFLGVVLTAISMPHIHNTDHLMIN